MKRNLFKRGMAGLLSLVMCLTALVGLGTTTAFAAGEQAEVYLISFPRSGDANLDYGGSWGHPNLQYMNGWYSGNSKYTTIRAMHSYEGNICYCIEPGTAQETGDRYTSKDETFWDNLPADFNSTISPYEMKLFIGRIMQYGYTGPISTSWRSQNSADAAALAEAMATQVLIWETIVGERDADFDHVSPGSYDAVKESVSAEHPLYSRFCSYYIDEGITGTSAEKRPQFMKMVEDARQKKFNMIITREVSRFARNTVDTLQYTRLLKEYGVEVFFLNDNIKTFDGDGELRLTIMATLAQDESRKTSIRVKAGQETSMQNGVFYGNGNILGYDRVGKEMVINPEQATTVRMIYDMYLSGMGVTTIQYELEKAGRLTALGKEQWFASYISKMLRNSFYCGIITYHKEYTPDFLKQKKIKNYGDLEYVQVQGTHEPIVTVEEYEQVQKLMDAKSAVLKNHNKGKRRTGRMQHTTVYGRLMICQCGNKFNLRFHSRDGRTDGVDYQCYTSVNRGSVAKRLNKGISIEHSCESPYIQGWKLEMMAEQVFDRYIENADKVMDLSYAMLEKHIADQEELPDNTDVIRRKQGEIEKLMNKRTNLIEMRAEGDIDKEMFRSKKQEIEDRVAKLTEEIKGLQPEKEQTSNEDYSVKLLELRERLKEYTGFDYSVIPESIVEAFIERIWVSKDEFRWYLRTGNNADSEFDPDDHIKIGAFTLTIDDAKKYIYSFSTRRRVYKWADLKVSVWI